MPSWLTLVLPSVLAFGGAYLGQLLARRSARELDVWRKREETMRMLRWASELAVDPREDRVALGTQMLAALHEAEIVQSDDQTLVTAAMSTVVSSAAGRYTVHDEGEHGKRARHGGDGKTP